MEYLSEQAWRRKSEYYRLVKRAKLWQFLILTLHSVAIHPAANSEPLEIGGKYDFFCRDGQNIKKAQLLLEDDIAYYVKISYISKTIIIRKENVVSTPVRYPPEPGEKPELPPPTRFLLGKFHLSADLGFRTNANSRLGDIFASGIHYGIQLELPLYKRLLSVGDALISQVSYSSYHNDNRHLLVYAAQIGVASYYVLFKSLPIEVKFEVLGGVGYRDMQGFVFKKSNNTPLFTAGSGLRAKFSSYFTELMITANYMYDDTILFWPLGISVRVGIVF